MLIIIDYFFYIDETLKIKCLFVDIFLIFKYECIPNEIEKMYVFINFIFFFLFIDYIFFTFGLKFILFC